MILELNNISVFYEKAEALKGISIKVEEGSITTLIGANGAGKTTTLRAISGLKKLKRGEILMRGKKIDKLPAHKIVDLGVAHVPEGRRVFGLMTVMHNLRIGAYLQKDKKIYKENLERVFHHFPQLAERTDQIANTMSGGEQQMLAMGRALMANPKLLLLDEPSLGLAPMMVNEIVSIINDLKKEGLSVLLVEQNASIALKNSDYGYLFETGKIALEGKCEDLVSNDHVQKVYLGG